LLRYSTPNIFPYVKIQPEFSLVTLNPKKIADKKSPNCRLTYSESTVGAKHLIARTLKKLLIKKSGFEAWLIMSKADKSQSKKAPTADSQTVNLQLGLCD